MARINHKEISLYEEAKAGFNSLIKQTVQVGAGFLLMLLVTGGKPPAFTVALSVVGGIAFVAWSEQKRLTNPKTFPSVKNSVSHQFQTEVKQLLEADTENLAELVKRAGLNPSEDLVGANFLGVKAVGCNMRYFNLSDADLSHADLSRADLSFANLSNAKLIQAKLSRAELNYCNLSNALLMDADLSHADFRNANLSGADLINADLSNAYLEGADLSGANLASAKVEKAVFGKNAGISEADKSDLEKRGAIFPQDILRAVEV